MRDDRLVRRDFVRRGAAATLAATTGMTAPPGKAAHGGSPPPDRRAKAAHIPCGVIGGVKISRLILGSNPLGGGAHSRDLIYVSRLLKEYNTEERILKTLELAESEGINTVLQGRTELIRKYNAERGRTPAADQAAAPAPQRRHRPGEDQGLDRSAHETRSRRPLRVW